MLDNKSFKAHSLTETGAMPVARGNVAFDLSALSTSLAKRTGADEYVSEPLSPAGGGSADAPTLPPPAAPALPAAADGGSERAPDAETYINTLESQVAELKHQLHLTTVNYVKAAEERDALEEQLVDQAKEIVEQEEELKQEKLRNQHLHAVNQALEESLRKSRDGPPSETEKAASSASEGGDEDSQDDVPMPPPEPAPPARVVDDLDEPMDAPQGDDLEKVLKDLVCKANEMKTDLEEVDLYPQFEDMYREVLSAEKALRDNRVNAYPGLVSSLEGQIEEAADELEQQLKVNERAGLTPNGDIVKRRRGKARR